jgi:hypothetical protein
MRGFEKNPKKKFRKVSIKNEAACGGGLRLPEPKKKMEDSQGKSYPFLPF